MKRNVKLFHNKYFEVNIMGFKEFCRRSIVCVLTLAMLLGNFTGIGGTTAYAAEGGNACAASHNYGTQWSQNDVAHYRECTDCGERKDAALHYYYNDCYPICVVCGYERTVGAHVYDKDIPCDPTCNICGQVRTVPDSAHTYDHDCDYMCNIPSCMHWRKTAHGYSSECDVICDKCNRKTRDVTVAHTYDNDCDTDCNSCGETREAPHPANSKWEHDPYYHWKHCLCGAKQHNYGKHNYNENDICTDCGFSWASIATSGWDFTLKDDGTYEVTGRGSSTGAKGVIPRHHEGKAVTSIGKRAFYMSWYQIPAEILIPEGITNIGSGAFTWCTGLRSVTFPGSIGKIPQSLFGDNESLTNITLIDGIYQIDNFSLTSVSTLKVLTIPKSVKTIERGFSGSCGVTIYYQGSVAEWGAINKPEEDGEWHWASVPETQSWKYGCHTVVCTDGTIKEHKYADVTYHSNNFYHWTHDCTCGAIDYSTQTRHSGGTGNPHEQVKCTACGEQYVNHIWAEKPTPSPGGRHHYIRCTVDGCYQWDEAEEHTYENRWDVSGTSHWKTCTVCGYKANEENHHGGTATCTEQAVCEDCGTSYGDLLPHHGGTATCTEKATCEGCGQKYGELHHYSAQWNSDGETHWHACGVCNAARKDEAVHTPGTDYANDKDSHWNKCTVCGAKVNVKSHTYSNHKCTDCGKDEFINSGPIVIPNPGGGGGVIADPE